MKKIIIAIFLFFILLGGWYFIQETSKKDVKGLDPLNTTYLINEESFTLFDGSIEKEIVPGSASKNKLSIFGEPVFGDIDQDGDDDAVVILVNDLGGSGTFYYAAIAANIDGEYKGTDAIFLGDRIAPQTFYIQDNRAKINYVDRAVGEDFSVQPSIGKSIHLQFDPVSLRLIQVAVNFEGEADPDQMTLGMKTWQWNKTIYNNDTELIPVDSKDFTLTFKENSVFSATTDCNSISGTYEIKDNQIIFRDISSTKMFCEGSQEQDFLSMLGKVQSFFFTNRGELIFELKFDTGSSIFR